MNLLSHPALLDWATVLGYVSFTVFIAWRILASKRDRLP